MPGIKKDIANGNASPERNKPGSGDTGNVRTHGPRQTNVDFLVVDSDPGIDFEQVCINGPSAVEIPGE